MTTYRYLAPFGPLGYCLDDEVRLTDLRFGEPIGSCSEKATDVSRQLDEYFGGSRTRFELVLAPAGTAFQHQVWAALQEIPHGRTTSYGELARALGRPGAARAVGRANATNPIALIVPCHRVIGASGALTGFAYGVETKRWLLEFEGATAFEDQATLFGI